MIQTGVRELEAAEGWASLSREERISALRKQMDQMLGKQPQVDVVPAEEVLALHPPLGEALVSGGLLRRAITECSDTPSLLAEILAQVSGSGGFVAVVGWSDLAYAAVATQGGSLERIVAIPDPGPDPLSVVSVLVSGVDLVVYRGAARQLTPVQARPLLGKLRTGVAALLLVGVTVGSPAARIRASVTGFRGIGEGTGRIRAVDLQVEVMAKGGRTQTSMSIGEQRTLTVM